MRNWISGILLFFSGMALGIWLWSVARQYTGQRHDEQLFDEERNSRPIQSPNAAQASGPKPPGPKAPGIKRGEVVGRLIIPRIHLRAMVREGDDDDTLGVALGHIPSTALPGHRGNVGVAGHRDTLFRGLAQVARNDEIELDTATQTYTYKVDEMSIVTPETVSVLAPGHRDQLTLVTCYPFNYLGSAPKRYIVQAHLISQNPVSQNLSTAVQR
jgi:sortase A